MRITHIIAQNPCRTILIGTNPCINSAIHELLMHGFCILNTLMLWDTTFYAS